MSNPDNNKTAFQLYETISENLRLINSLSWLVTCTLGESGDDEMIADTMQAIAKLKAEASEANEALFATIKGGAHE